MRVVLTILVLLGFLITGCVYKQHAEQLASLSTVVTPLARGENFYDLKLAPGPNEEGSGVFVRNHFAARGRLA